MNTDYLGLANLVVGVLGILVTLFIFYTQINRHLKELLERRGPILSQEQALDLLDLYLFSVKNDMQHSARHFVDVDYKRCVDDQNNTEAQNVVYRVASEAIQQNRAHLKHFFLPGMANYEQFLNKVSPLEGGVILEAKQRIFTHLEEAIKAKRSPQTLYSELVRMTEQANSEARGLIQEEIRDRYDGSSAH